MVTYMLWDYRRHMAAGSGRARPSGGRLGAADWPAASWAGAGARDAVGERLEIIRMRSRTQ